MAVLVHFLRAVSLIDLYAFDLPEAYMHRSLARCSQFSPALRAAALLVLLAFFSLGGGGGGGEEDHQQTQCGPLSAEFSQ